MKAMQLINMFILVATVASGQVKFGIDNLIDTDFALLESKRIVLVSHAAARTARGTSTAEEFAGTSKLRLLRILTPEHGFYGVIEAGKHVDDDTLLGVPTRSLYGAVRRPDASMISDADAVVIDLQDIGVRSYTFMSTMIEVMDACAEFKIPCMVLDRPNPLGGTTVSGCVVDDSLRSFIGRIPIPYVHGCTLGELATMANQEHWLTTNPKRREQMCSLTVVRCKRWVRSLTWEGIDRPWYPTSPNIPSVAAIRGYAMTGLLGELGVWSIGMGTNSPFQLIGAPGLDLSPSTIGLLRDRGVDMARARYKPSSGKHAATVCDGYYLQPRSSWRPMEAAAVLLWEARKRRPEAFPDTLIRAPHGRMFAKACGLGDLVSALCQGAPLSRIDALSQRGLQEYRELRRRYLLYGE
jgi:uncharacterized protein YbbC (DUF1343 family)